MDFKEPARRRERILISLKPMQPQACLSEPWKMTSQMSHHTPHTRLESQRDAMCSIIFHNINTVGPWKDWIFYRWARGRQLPWLCVSSQHLSRNGGARCCAAWAGAGQALMGTRSVHVWAKAKGTHSWGAHGGGQTEEKSISGKSSHCAEWGNARTHRSSLRKRSTSVKFHWI